jgi:hypothetical protein
MLAPPVPEKEDIVSNLTKGLRPDITAAQVIGLLIVGLPILANLLRAFGVYDLNPEQTTALEDGLKWAALVAGTLFVSDAGLRAARNQALSKVEAAAVSAPTPLEPAVGVAMHDAQPGESVAVRLHPVQGVSLGGPLIDGRTPEQEAADPLDVDDDADLDAVPDDDLPSDDDEFGSPPPEDVGVPDNIDGLLWASAVAATLERTGERLP